MNSVPSISIFVFAIGAAFAGGIISKRLGQLPLLGYLIAGIIVGPSVTGFIKDTNQIQVLAQIGISFLMFQAGTELSFSNLCKVKRAALGGPFLQLILTIPFLLIVVLLTDWPAGQVSYLALILSLSSTTVAIKLMSERGETDTQHGKITVAYSIVQDIPMIPAIVIVTAIASSSGGDLLAVSLSIAKALGFVLVAYYVGGRVAPSLLSRASSYGKELFILSAVLLALGTAYLTEMMGLSLALGAFIAGLVVADSEVSRRVLREVSSLSDIFITFFFMSVGMLLDISFVLSHLPAVLAFVTAILVGKAILITVIFRLFRYPSGESLLMGLALAQVGEEAFLLAQIALHVGFLSSDTFSLVLAGSVISIVLNPLLVQATPLLLKRLQAVPFIGEYFKESLITFPVKGQTGIQSHTIVCGFGGVGHQVVDALDMKGLPYVIVEHDPTQLSVAREKNLHYILGNAAQEEVLKRANIMSANCLVLTMPDPLTTERIIQMARRMRKSLYIVTKAYADDRAVERLSYIGATEVIQPSFEASLEFIRYVFRSNGVNPRDAERFITTKRAWFYG